MRLSLYTVGVRRERPLFLACSNMISSLGLSKKNPKCKACVFCPKCVLAQEAICEEIHVIDQ